MVLLFSFLFRKTDKDAVLVFMFSLGRLMLHSFVLIQIFNLISCLNCCWKCYSPIGDQQAASKQRIVEAQI